MDDLATGEGLEILLLKVTGIAEEAGKAVMRLYEGPALDLMYKGDKSPLTVADLVSHSIIVQRLARLKSKWRVLSEESECAPFETRRDWRLFWLVDPLDGTKEFLERNGEFTVNIALIEGDRPILGVVYAPAIHVMYYAARNVGAFKRERDRASPIWAQCSHESTMRIVISRSHADGEIERYTRQFGKCEFVLMGSSLKLCMVAEGSADIYPRAGPTMEWDTAAAQCILEQAGGSVSCSDGRPLHYNKAVLCNPDFVAQGNRHLKI